MVDKIKKMTKQKRRLERERERTSPYNIFFKILNDHIWGFVTLNSSALLSWNKLRAFERMWRCSSEMRIKEQRCSIWRSALSVDDFRAALPVKLFSLLSFVFMYNQIIAVSFSQRSEQLRQPTKPLVKNHQIHKKRCFTNSTIFSQVNKMFKKYKIKFLKVIPLH